MSDHGDDTPLGRWSRRKQADRVERDSVPAEPETPTNAPDTTNEAEAEPLPPIESLTAESDYTPFLKEGVPERLRALALRRLWRSNPVLANLDGLNDYDENFASSGVGTVVATAFKLGKGMVRDEPETVPETDSAEAETEDSLDSAEAETPEPDGDPDRA